MQAARHPPRKSLHRARQVHSPGGQSQRAPHADPREGESARASSPLPAGSRIRALLRQRNLPAQAQTEFPWLRVIVSRFASGPFPESLLPLETYTATVAAAPGTRSANTKESRSTISPTATGIAL